MEWLNIQKPSTRLASSYNSDEDGLISAETDEVIVEEVEEPHKINNFDYSTLSLSELKGLCKERGIEGYSKLNKSQLIEKLG